MPVLAHDDGGVILGLEDTEGITKAMPACAASLCSRDGMIDDTSRSETP